MMTKYLNHPGLILGLHPANERRQSNAVSHLLGANIELALPICVRVALKRWTHNIIKHNFAEVSRKDSEASICISFAIGSEANERWLSSEASLYIS